MLKQVLPTLLCFTLIFNFTTLFGQAGCGATFGTMTEPLNKTTLCDDGSDDAVFLYNAADNLSNPNLPDFAYVFEGPNGLTFLETGSLNLNPADFGAIAGDSICVTGFAINLEDINNLISTLSNSFICSFAGFDAATCAIISDLNDAGGIQDITQALTFAEDLGQGSPTTTAEAIAVLDSVDSASSALGGVCYAVSNNGVGLDYCYVVEVCDDETCPLTLTLNANPELAGTYQAENYIESTSIVNVIGGDVNYYAGTNYIELQTGFEADTLVNFNAEIISCAPSN